MKPLIVGLSTVNREWSTCFHLHLAASRQRLVPHVLRGGRDGEQQSRRARSSQRSAIG